ncbi:MAG: hypothetical protein K0R34_4415, partial [Herbinix sp.]|nr:hypothetical protein [Herbinix sp.]
MHFQKAKKWVAVLMVSALSAGLLVGCGKDTKEEGVTADSPAVTEEATEGETEEVSTEPVEISMFVPSRLPEAIYNPDTMTFKTLAERLNLKLNIESVV